MRGVVGHPPASKCLFILMCFYSDVQKARSSVGYRQFCLGRGFWVAGGPQMFYYSDVVYSVVLSTDWLAWLTCLALLACQLNVLLSWCSCEHHRCFSNLMFFILMPKIALWSFPKHRLKGIVVVKRICGAPAGLQMFLYSDVLLFWCVNSQVKRWL